jgi:hypothetical protein
VENKINLFIFYPEVPPILLKDTYYNEELRMKNEEFATAVLKELKEDRGR